MLERWDALACFPYLSTVKIGNNDRSMNTGFGNDLPPWRNDQAVPVGLASALMPAGLGGGQHEATILDGACAQQHVPVGLPGWLGEGRRDRQEIGTRLGQRAIKLGKP